MKFVRWGLLFLLVVLIVAWFALPGIVERTNNRVTQPPPYRASAEAEALHKELRVPAGYG